MIFIAHSRQDRELAIDLESALKELGDEVWVDYSRIPVGERFVHEIASAIRRSHCLLLISSESSSRSYWVSRELACAARLRAAGMLDKVCRLETEPVAIPDVPFDGSFTSVEELLRHFEREDQREAIKDGGPDPHRVDIAYHHVTQEPRVWLGFSAELAALDRWFFDRRQNLWIAGLGGAGKSSLVSVWLSALRLLGYREPLDLSVCTWSFYQMRDAQAAYDELAPWVREATSSRLLLFLDGADEGQVELIHELGPLMEHPHHLATIVTSREPPPTALSARFQVLQLSSLTREDAELLVSRSGAEPPVVERLLDAFGGHAFSISLVASLLEQGHDIEDLLGELGSGGGRPSRRRPN